MPQLNPEPWFFTLIISWSILMLLAPKKILNHTMLNDPSPKTIKISPNPWIWPWQ
nr:ATPase 8 [Buergeria japonica]